ncbi:MAG: hypothetical protein Q8920_10175 [Bacillota bacterium]|nr:hypothetical protein [Bacillota bacterium]
MKADFLKGRYGIDTLTFVLLFVAVMFVKFDYLWVLSIALLLYCIFRTFSQNRESRLKELQYFNKIFSKITRFIMQAVWKLKVKYSNYKMRSIQKKQFAFIKCPSCKKTLRLPKGKGKLQVTCPVCKTEFFKKT